jgi:hypothetical protein
LPYSSRPDNRKLQQEATREGKKKIMVNMTLVVSDLVKGSTQIIFLQKQKIAMILLVKNKNTDDWAHYSIREA